LRYPQTITDAVRAAACRPEAAVTGPAHRHRTRPTARTEARTYIRRRPAVEEVVEVEVVEEMEVAAETRPIPVPTTETVEIPVTTVPPCPTPRRLRRLFS